jgi:hypothetical protein
MTVSELIEELQKFPPHHRVFIEHPDWQAEVRHDGFATELASVADVRPDDACSVIIDATGGVQ